MTNKEIIKQIHPGFYTKIGGWHVRRRVFIEREIIAAMDAARKDEFFKTLDFISGLGLVEDNDVWIQAAGNSTIWTPEQLYELFKKEK